MNGIIWLWKHRHCWKQLKYLYNKRFELKRILSKVSIHPDSPGEVENILACLREFGRVPLTRQIPPRPWPSPPPSNRPNALAWLKEKAELLKTHAGWFVAYQDGERVALEPDCDRLVNAIGAKLGEGRRPVDFHEIVEKPVVHRGPSPRYMKGDGPFSNNEAFLRYASYWEAWLGDVSACMPQWSIDAGRD